MTGQNQHSEYDSEPVVFCARCYSLKIKYEEAIDSECCADCGCSDVREASIEEWERLYEHRYGKKYVVRDSDPKKTPIFKMPLDKLKILVYNHPSLDYIIHYLYPRFPKGYSKVDSVILLFSSLIRDNRLDDLRLLLLKIQSNGREEVKQQCHYKGNER